MGTTWNAAIVERFVMDKMHSMMLALDVLGTGSEHMSYEDNFHVTMHIFRTESNDMNMVLQGHQDAVLAPKHRSVKAVVATFHSRLGGLKEPEHLIREAIAYLAGLRQAMLGNKEAYSEAGKGRLVSGGDKAVQGGLPVLLPEVSEDSGQAEQAGHVGDEADTGQTADIVGA